MTQKTIKALYKQPVNYKLIRDGYKTTNGVIQAQDGMPKVVDLSVPSELYTTDLQYNVDVDVNGAPVITTSEFTLPDDQTCEAKKYCYAPKGTNYNYSEKQNVRHYDNFTKIGSPTISQNGILSDITTSNYLRLPNNFNSGNNSWEMLFKIKTSSDITTEQSWIGSSNKTNFTYPLWRLRNEYICLYLSSDGSNWDISSKAQTFQVSANTWYWVKLKFTGSSYESYYSTNGIDYILAYSVSSTSIIYQNQLWNIGCNNWSEGEYLQWLGIIDLSESYIKINDEICWRGANSTIKEHQYITAKETINGCLYNYNDDGSEHSFDVYYDSNYTQPILVPAGQTYSEGTKVDTITLPKHKTWEYSSGGIWNSYAEIDVSNSNYTNTDGNLVLTEYTGNAQDVTLPNPEL